MRTLSWKLCDGITVPLYLWDLIFGNLKLEAYKIMYLNSELQKEIRIVFWK